MKDTSKPPPSVAEEDVEDFVGISIEDHKEEIMKAISAEDTSTKTSGEEERKGSF